MFSDSFIAQPDVDDNFTLDITSDTFINMSTSEPKTTSTLKSFIDALRIMFTFRVSGVSGVPNVVSTILSFINWFLVILLGISIYRIVNPLA